MTQTLLCYGEHWKCPRPPWCRSKPPPRPQLRPRPHYCHSQHHRPGRWPRDQQRHCDLVHLYHHHHHHHHHRRRRHQQLGPLHSSSQRSPDLRQASPAGLWPPGAWGQQGWTCDWRHGSRCEPTSPWPAGWGASGLGRAQGTALGWRHRLVGCARTCRKCPRSGTTGWDKDGQPHTATHTTGHTRTTMILGRRHGDHSAPPGTLQQSPMGTTGFACRGRGGERKGVGVGVVVVVGGG